MPGLPALKVLLAIASSPFVALFVLEGREASILSLHLMQVAQQNLQPLTWKRGATHHLKGSLKKIDSIHDAVKSYII